MHKTYAVLKKYAAVELPYHVLECEGTDFVTVATFLTRCEADGYAKVRNENQLKLEMLQAQIDRDISNIKSGFNNEQEIL